MSHHWAVELIFFREAKPQWMSPHAYESRHILTEPITIYQTLRIHNSRLYLANVTQDYQKSKFCKEFFTRLNVVILHSSFFFVLALGKWPGKCVGLIWQGPTSGQPQAWSSPLYWCPQISKTLAHVCSYRESSRINTTIWKLSIGP